MPTNRTDKMKITAREFIENSKKYVKYKNEKTEYEGITFDSKKEKKTYIQLRLLEKCGKIFDLKRQVSFELLPAQYRVINGKKTCIERACKYIADFTYNDENMNLVVVDCKSEITRKISSYVLKRKMLLFFHNIILKEI